MVFVKLFNKKGKNFNRFAIGIFLISSFLIGCSLFNPQLKAINKAEEAANNIDDAKLNEMYINPSDLEKFDNFKSGFTTLRTVCEGNIHFKIIKKNTISDDKSDITIGMYCDGAIDFRKAGKGYENAVRQEAKKDNLIDTAEVTMVKKEDKWLIESFDW